MERIQYYPSDELKKCLMEEADRRNISISQLSVDIMSEYFGLSTSNKEPLPILLPKIMNEVAEYIGRNQVGTEFDLLNASETFRNIHMVADGKPSANRASVGRSLSAKVKMGTKPFDRVEPVYGENGTLKKSINHAQMYRIFR